MNSFIRLDTRFVRTSNLSHLAFRLYALLLAYQGANAAAFPSIPTLCAVMKCSANTIRQALHSLEIEELVRIKRSRGRSQVNSYIVSPSVGKNPSQIEPFQAKNPSRIEPFRAENPSGIEPFTSKDTHESQNGAENVQSEHEKTFRKNPLQTEPKVSEFTSKKIHEVYILRQYYPEGTDRRLAGATLTGKSCAHCRRPLQSCATIYRCCTEGCVQCAAGRCRRITNDSAFGCCSRKCADAELSTRGILKPRNTRNTQKEKNS